MTIASGILPVQLDELRERARRERLARFDPIVLAWLAAVPKWTDQLADEAGFPVGSSSTFADLLERLAAARLIERREALDSSGKVVTAFWLPSSVRPYVGRYLRESWSRTEIEQAIASIASGLNRPQVDIAGVPSQWLEVAEQHERDPSGRWLIQDVGSSVDAGHTAEALGLIATAQALVDVVGEPLLSSARRAQLRVDRAYQEEQDAHYLEHYHRRPNLEAALDDLVWGEGTTWAVHLLGDGGLGKTMVVRYLASTRFVADRNKPRFAVARIDFDQLDPRYPEERPAELLLALAGGLTGFAISRGANFSLRRLEDASQALHESTATPTAGAATSGLLDSAIDAFVDYLSQLVKPVVLVLDTCEELAKLYAPGAVAPAIERTFSILERVHASSPFVRVVFAGRRSLAPSPWREPNVQLPPRPYLRVVEVGGFSREEANGYLDQRDSDRRIGPALRAAVLKRCVWGDQDGDERFQPFDLAGYCDWALDDPELDPEMLLAAGGDPYVEQRILGRLGSVSIRDSLPVAVELGRFDEMMIGPALARRGIDANVVFPTMATQEWVTTVAFTSGGRPRVIEIDERLRTRLRQFISAHPIRFPFDSRGLGRDIAEFVATTAIDELTREAVEAVVRLLPASEASAAWSGLEERIVREGKWAWAVTVTPQAASAESGRAAAGGATILAAIRATQAAATLRLPGRPGLRALWQEVARLAHRHPDPGVAAVLAGRAACGLVAAAPELTDDSLVRGLKNAAGSTSNVPAGSVLAAIDALTASEAGLPQPLEGVIDSLCASTEGAVAAAALLARSVHRFRAADLAPAADDAERALSMAKQPSHRAYADWVVPFGLFDRCRLARVRLAIARGEPLGALPLTEWRDDALPHLQDIDAERLVAALILFELSHRLPRKEVLEAIGTAETFEPARRPTAWWHRHPPLCIELARAWAAIGEPAVATRLLADRREQAVKYGEAGETIEACDACFIDLSRMYRTALSESLHRLAREGSDTERDDAWAALALAEGQTPERIVDTGSWHGWWRSQIRRAGEPVPKSWSIGPPAGVELGPPDVVLIDSREAAVVTGAESQLQGWEGLRRDHHRLESAGLLLWDGTGTLLGRVLRADLFDPTLKVATDNVLAGLPPRAVAEAAMREAELLALRLPSPAVGLLDIAVRQFQAADDAFGHARAMTLRVLTFVRAGNRTELPELPHAWSWQVTSQADPHGAWALRFRVAQELPPEPPANAGRSPELDLRPLAARPGTAAELPMPAEYFVGREAELRWLRQALVKSRRVILSGLGGIGKSQLALRYLLRHRARYRRGTFWLRGEEEAAFDADLAGLAEFLDLPQREQPDQEVVIAAVRRWLAQNDEWLLVVDNLEGEAVELAERWLPSDLPGHILITSQHKLQGPRHVLEPLPMKAATDFLLQRTRQPDAGAARTVADRLGRLPLALEQASAYLEQTGEQLGTYAELLQMNLPKLMNARSETEHAGSVVATWALSLQRLEEQSAASVDLLRLCAFMSPEAIPIRLLEQASGVLTTRSPLVEATSSRVRLNLVISALVDYSLMRRQGGRLTLHHLVQTVVRDSLSDADRQLWASTAVRMLAAVFPAESGEPATWADCQELLPHALSAADYAIADESELIGSAWLLDRAATYNRSRAEFSAARPLFERALAIREQVLGPDHPDTASSLNNLARLLYAQGELAAARPLQERALAIRERVLGPDHPDTASSLNNLAVLLHSQGELAAARPLFERALAIQEKLWGPSNPDTASSLNNLALMLCAQGELATARPLFERALAIYERVLGPDHPNTAHGLNNLALLLQDQGELAAAQPLFERALAIRERVLGPDHPDTASSLNNLARLLQDQGALAAARPLFERALAIREQVLGPDHPDTAQGLNNLARLLQDQGELAAARPLLQRAQAIRERELGPDRPQVQWWDQSGQSIRGLARHPLDQESVSFRLFDDPPRLGVYTCRVVVERAGRLSIEDQRLANTYDLDPSGQPPALDQSVLMLGRSRRPRTYLVVPIDVAARAEDPWEQWLDQARGKLAPLWVRWSGTSAWSAPPESDWRFAPATYHGTPGLAPSDEVLGRIPAAAASEPGVARRLLHLVGTPVTTAAGWRVRVAGALSEAAQEASRGTSAGEELLGADQLAVGRTALVVMQAEPVDGPPQPLRDLRPGLTGFARSLLDAGASAVLGVPPLPDEVAKDVVNLVWSHLATRRKPPTGKALLDTFSRVRKLVAEHEPVQSDHAHRPSLDVLLFL